MTIGATDLKLRASEVMADVASLVVGVGNGGRMGTLVITGTPENDVFPDVTSGQRAAGVRQWRKVWLQAMSDENDQVSGAAAAVTSRPSDANCRITILQALNRDGALNAIDLGAAVHSVALTTASASAGATSLVLDQTTEPNASGAATVTLYIGQTAVVVNGATRELAVVQSVLGSTVTFNAPLVNAFPSGSTVSGLLSLGDLRATVSLPPFSQQTWLRNWSDSVTTPATATYAGSPTLINAGAINDRWSIVFKTTTTFDLVSERYGQLVSGSTAADFIPVNPATNQPYFTLLAAGWGSGWLPGNCLRFNTTAAAAPFWVQRTVLPGASAGTVNAQISMTGDVNA